MYLIIVSQKPHRSFTRDGDNLLLELQFSLEESLCGWENVIKTIDGTQIKIEKPGPTQPGSSDRHAGLGMPIFATPSQRGDLIVKYTVKYPASLSSLEKARLQAALRGLN